VIAKPLLEHTDKSGWLHKKIIN